MRQQLDDVKNNSLRFDENKKWLNGVIDEGMFGQFNMHMLS